MGWYPYWKKVPDEDVRRLNDEFARKGVSTTANPYYGINVRNQEADARTRVMRGVLGFDEMDLDEDGHAVDGARGVYRVGLVVTAGQPPRDMSESERLRRLDDLQVLGDDQSLYAGGFTHPDPAVRLARRKRWGRPRRWGR